MYTNNYTIYIIAASNIFSLFHPYDYVNFDLMFSRESDTVCYSRHPKNCILALTSNAPLNFSAITFDFGMPYFMNHIKFDGEPEASEDPAELRNPFMYKLQVSKDGSVWDTVVDHSICKSYHTQDLYFPTKAAK